MDTPTSYCLTKFSSNRQTLRFMFYSVLLFLFHFLFSYFKSFSLLSSFVIFFLINVLNKKTDRILPSTALPKGEIAEEQTIESKARAISATPQAIGKVVAVCGSKVDDPYFGVNVMGFAVMFGKILLNDNYIFNLFFYFY